MGTRVRVLNIVTCSTMDVTGLPSLIVQLIPFYVCWHHHSWAHSQPKHTLSSFCLKVHYCILFCLIKVSNQPQYDQLGSMRQTLFQYIKSCHPDDLEPCFNLLRSLTNNGNNIYLIEEQIGTFIFRNYLAFYCLKS